MDPFDSTMEVEVTEIPMVIVTGQTYVEPIEFVTDNDDVIPLDGVTGSLVFQDSPEATEKILELTTENGMLVIDFAGGTVTPQIPLSTMNTLPAPWCGVWRLRLTSPDGIVARVLGGPAAFKKGF